MNRYILVVLLLSAFLFTGLVSAAPPLDINTATVEQLADTLAGVGKVKAQAIVDDRTKNGPFKSVDDLVRVKGVGPKLIEKNRNLISVGSEAAAAGNPAAPPAAAPPKDKK